MLKNCDSDLNSMHGHQQAESGQTQRSKAATQEETTHLDRHPRVVDRKAERCRYLDTQLVALQYDDPRNATTHSRDTQVILFKEPAQRKNQ